MNAPRTAVVTALALVAACAPEPTSGGDNAARPANLAATIANTAAPPAQPDPALAIDGEGLRLFNPINGLARPIPFGTQREATLAALAFRGAPSDTGTLEECGAGPLDQASWPDGLTLYFQEGKFLGWALGRNATSKLTTAFGIGLGSTRAELEAAYSTEVAESSLGTEFSAGDIFGILDGKGAKARISHLWAGASCNMR